MKNIFYIILLFISCNILYAQDISIEFGIKWEKKEYIFNSDSIVNSPILTVTYRNNSDDDYYFLKQATCHNNLPNIVGCVSLVQFGTLEDFQAREDGLEIAMRYQNYDGYNFNVKIINGWAVLPDSISIYGPYFIDPVQCDLSDIYKYLASKNFVKRNDDAKLYLFRQAVIEENDILNRLAENFVFVKAKQSYTDELDIAPFQIIKGSYTFFQRDDEPLPDSVRVYRGEAKLPDNVGIYKLYSGKYLTNKVTVKF